MLVDPPATISAGTASNLALVFRPMALGEQVATLSFSNSGAIPSRTIRLAGEGEAVRLFMRVTKPMRRVKLVVTSGGETVLTKPLLVAKPSEMIAADLPADKVAGLKADITVAIAEGV